jgi:hypothetical protein
MVLSPENAYCNDKAAALAKTLPQSPAVKNAPVGTSGYLEYNGSYCNIHEGAANVCWSLADGGKNSAVPGLKSPIYCCGSDADCQPHDPVAGKCNVSTRQCTWGGKDRPPPVVPGNANNALPALTQPPQPPLSPEALLAWYKSNPPPPINPSVKPLGLAKGVGNQFRMTLWHEGVVSVTKMSTLISYYEALTSFLKDKGFDRCFAQVMDPGATKYDKPTFPYSQPDFLIDNYLSKCPQDESFVAGALLYVNPMSPILLSKNGTFIQDSKGKWIPNPKTKGMFKVCGGMGGNNPDYKVCNPDGCGAIYHKCTASSDPTQQDKTCFLPNTAKAIDICNKIPEHPPSPPHSHPPSRPHPHPTSCDPSNPDIWCVAKTGGYCKTDQKPTPYCSGVDKVTGSPVVCCSTSVTPSPVTPSPTTHHTPSPTIHVTPSPTTHHTPSPTIHVTPSPTTHHTPSPTIHVTPSPTIHVTPSPTISSCDPATDGTVNCQKILGGGAYCNNPGPGATCHDPAGTHVIPCCPVDSFTSEGFDQIPCVPGHDKDPRPNGCHSESTGQTCLLNSITGKSECTDMKCQNIKYQCQGDVQPGGAECSGKDPCPIGPCCVAYPPGCPDNIEQMCSYIGYVNKLARDKGVKQITSIVFDGEDLGLYGSDGWGMYQVWQAIRKYCPEVKEAGFAHGPGASACASYTNVAFPEMYWIGELKPPPGTSVIAAQSGSKWSVPISDTPNTTPIAIPSGNSSGCDARSPGQDCVWCENVAPGVKLDMTTEGGVCCEFCKTQVDTDYNRCLAGADAACVNQTNKTDCITTVKRNCLLCANCRQAIYVRYKNDPQGMMTVFRKYMPTYMENTINSPGTCPLFSLENAHVDLQSETPKGCVQTHFNDGSDPDSTFCGTFDGFGCWKWESFIDFLNLYAQEVYTLDPTKKTLHDEGKYYIDIGIYEWQFVPLAWSPKMQNSEGVLAKLTNPKKPWLWIMIVALVLVVAVIIWLVRKRFR